MHNVDLFSEIVLVTSRCIVDSLELLYRGEIIRLTHIISVGSLGRFSIVGRVCTNAVQFIAS